MASAASKIAAISSAQPAPPAGQIVAATLPPRFVTRVSSRIAARGLSEDDIVGFGGAQTHLIAAVSVARIVDETGVNLGPVSLQQIRLLLRDHLGT